jgi:putative intracellular protease/amidase
MREIWLFVFDGFADWEPALALAGLSDMAEFRREPWRTVTVGFTSRPVTSMAGLRVLPDRSLDAVEGEAPDFFLLPGGEMWHAEEKPEVTALVRRLEQAGTPIGAICAATGALAHAGLLDDRRHTSNSLDFLKSIPAYRGEALYVPAGAIADRGVVTAPGTGHLEFAREIFRLLGAFDDRVIAAWYDFFRSPGDAGALARFREAAGAAG